MKFKMPEYIGKNSWFTDKDVPCCVVGHIVSQLNFDLRLWLEDAWATNPFDFIKKELNVTEDEVCQLQTDNDRAETVEERQQIFRRFLEARGHEVEG